MSMMSDKAQKQGKQTKIVEPAKTPAIAVESVEATDPLAGIAITAEEFRPANVEGLEVTVKQDFPPDPDDIKTPVLVVASPRVRVVADGKVMLGACMHRFRAGNVLDPTHYDARTFKQITAALKVEPITD